MPSKEYYKKHRSELLLKMRRYWRSYYKKNKVKKRLEIKKWRRSKKGVVLESYKSMVKRVKRSPSYLTRKINISKSEFVDLVLSKKKFHSIFNLWVKSGYKFRLRPTIDRINNSGNYETSNIQILSLENNSRKGSK